MMKLSEEWRVLTEMRGSLPVMVEKLPMMIGLELRFAYLSDQISGMIERIDHGFALTVNTLDSDTRKRFTIAHELGHYMLHRHLIGDGLDDDRLYRSTDVGKYHNTRVGRKEEIEANRFAAWLLMPHQEVAREWEKADGDITQMAARFGVSEKAMQISISQLG